MTRTILATAAFLFSAACAPLPDTEDPLDHTSSAAISDPAECQCLEAKKLVVSPSYQVACYSEAASGCGVRLDCIVPGVDENTRREVLACRAPQS